MVRLAVDMYVALQHEGVSYTRRLDDPQNVRFELSNMNKIRVGSHLMKDSAADYSTPTHDPPLNTTSTGTRRGFSAPVVDEANVMPSHNDDTRPACPFRRLEAAVLFWLRVTLLNQLCPPSTPMQLRRDGMGPTLPNPDPQPTAPPDTLNRPPSPFWVHTQRSGLLTAPLTALPP